MGIQGPRARNVIASLVMLVTLLLAVACQSATPSASPKPSEQPKSPAASPQSASPSASAQAKPASPTPAGPPTKIKIGLPVVGTHTLPATIAVQKGFFKEENIEAELIAFQQGVQASEALAAGETEFGLGIAAALKMTLRGADLKVVSGIVTRPQLILMGKADIQSVQGLKGKKVAAARIGDVGTYQLFAVLQQFGLTPEKDVEMVYMAGDRLPTLLQGVADATAIVPPGNVRAAKAGFKEIVRFSEVESIRDWPVTGLVTTGKLIREKPDLILRTVRAMSKAQDFTINQQDETAAIMAKEFNLSPEEAKEVYRSLRIVYAPRGEITAKNVQFEIDASSKELEIKEPVPLEKVADFSFQNKALGR